MKKDEDKSREELLEEVVRLREKISLAEQKSVPENKSEYLYLVDGKYSIRDLVDLEKLERIFEKFSLATGYTIGFIEQPSQKVIISTGWRDICNKFHRAFPESEKYCKESSIYLMKGLAKLKDMKIRTCESGLVDGATPVIVRGSHIASLATGQALFAEPDVERFKEQAKRYGYNEEKYLAALSKVPVVKEEQFRKVLDFLSEIAVIVAELGLNNLEIKEKNMELEEVITKYSHICSELEYSENRYRELVNSLPQVIFETNLKGNITFASGNLFNFFGYDEDDLKKGLNALQLLTDEDRERGYENFQKVLMGVKAGDVEYRGRRKDGNTLPVVIHATSIMVKNKPAGLRGIIIDITENKKGEEERVGLERQLRHAQKMEAIGTLAGGIAHDFNNILTGIIGYAYLMYFDMDRAHPFYSYIQEIFNACNRAKDLIKHILTFSRSSEQKKDATSVKLIVKEVFVLLKASFPATIEIYKHIEGDSHIILADATQIHQLLMNLCTNAAHAMRGKGGILNISLTDMDIDMNQSFSDLKEGRYVRLTVKDTGCGMDSSILEKMFDPYFTTKEPGEGTGLGLAVVLGIVKSHDGVIRVNSEPGKGTTFDVFFPRLEEGVTVKAESNLILPGGQERILFVDNEKTVVFTIGMALERLGYKVVSITDSTEALSVFQKEPDRFDIVVTDYTMPRMTGVELAKTIKQIRPVPVILCTGFCDSSINREAIKAIGIKALLMKPYTIEELARLLRKTIDTC